MGDDSEWMKLPTEEKCNHKVWKARLAGYEELIKLFSSLDNEKSSEFSKCAGLMKKIVTDSNAVAQEKGLDAVIAFVENASTQIASRTISDVVGGVVTKCLSASKQKTKDKGMEIVLLYIELDKPDIVQEALMGGLENKNPKVVVGSIQCLRTALRDFGTKVIQVKPLLKSLPKLLDDRDKNVREETKQLVIELYRWIGAALKPQMTNFKPIQVQEFEEEFEKITGGKPVQTRFMRSQQDLKAKMEEQAAAASAGGGEDSVSAEEEEAGGDDLDPYELMEAVDILSKLPKDFYEKIEAKKWQERREALEALQKLAEAPKIENGSFGTLISAVHKVIAKDTNVMLVALAGNILAKLAKGLRKNFATYGNQSISVILEKFKEKKQTVVQALREASDAVYAAGVPLDAVLEDLLAALENKNPNIKAETALFISRCFQRCTQATLPKKMLKAFCSALLKTVNDTDPGVREASFEALGVAMKVVSEKHIMPFLADVDSIKMQKIQERCQSAVLLNAKGEPRQGAGGGGEASAAVAKKNEPKPVARPATAKPAAQSSESTQSSGAAKTAKKPAGAKKVVGGGGGKGKGKGKAQGSKQEAGSEPVLSDEAVEEKASEALPGDVITGLASSNWKDRLAAIEKFAETVKGLSKEEIPCQAFVRVLKKKPGLKDNNFQVLKLKFELLGHLGQNAKFSRQAAEFVLAEIIDKVGDIKVGAAAQETLSCISEACTLEFVSEQAMALAFEQKNPKNQVETLNWLSHAVKEFGLKVNIKPMIAAVNKAFAATNPAVRTAAVTLLATVYMYMGAKLRVFFEEEKPALLQQIDAEFEKVKGEKPPAPTRGLAPGGGDDEEEADEEEKQDDDAEPQDLVPRTDISERITEDLLTMMADKNWKVRNEALQKVTEILKEAKFITPNLNGLPEAIKARLSESNKNLQTIAITICSTLAQALGHHSKQHVRVIAPGLISCLTDSKPQLRAAVIASLNLWVEQTTLTPFVECEALADGLKTENPNLRTELLGWLTEKLPTHKTLPPELRDCLPYVLACLEDRSGDVRKKAQDAIVPFMIHVGYNNFVKAAGKLKPASKDQVQPLLEKAKGELPAKAPPKKKAAAAAAPARPAPVMDDEEEEESRPAAPAPSKTDTKSEKPDLKSKALGKNRGKAPQTSSKKKEEEETGPVMTLTVPKEQRFKDEKNMKVLKWNFIELRGEFVEQLKGQMEKNFSPGIMAQLFHTDFKFHIKAIEQLIGCIDSMENETLGNLDMILKWCTIRFFDTNPSMINKALDYLQQVFSRLADLDYHLPDLEASSFIPYLVLKVGDAKDNVRRDVRNIFKLICKVYPASKMFSYLLDGIKSKNSKQRTECLEELACLIEAYGINICQPSPAQALKLIAAQIGDRDNGVRNAALNTVVTAYMILGEGLYKYIGILKDKDQSLLEERIKRSSKNKPAKPAVEERPRTAPAPHARQAASQPAQQRPGSAMPKSSSSNAIRKEFALDVDLEPFDPADSALPQLLQMNTDHMYEPVQLPKLRCRARPPSPLMKHLTSSDAVATIGYVISLVTNPDINVSIQALAQIDEVLKEEERAEALAGHVDKLLLMLSMQFRMAHSTHMGDPQVSRDDVVKLYRCLLSTLLQLFQTSSLGRKASKDVLRDLMTSLVTVLLDDRLMDVEDGPQVVRSVNLTVVRIVEKADCTNIMGAMIRLLQDCVGSETCSAKFVEIVMKCLWKMVRFLPDISNDLNIDRILLDAHQFMRAFPSHTWKERPSDQPLRTIKTVLHSLAKQKGNKILSHTGLIDSNENSEVEAYLHKVLKDGVAGHNARNEEITADSARGSSSKSKRLSKSTHDMLVEIFKKIGSKENTKEGLNDLYDFKKKYPDADLEPFLKKSSQFFQNYIERGLKNIEQERDGKKPDSFDSIPAVKPLSESAANGETVGADYYMQRLNALRASCGLDMQEARADRTATATSKSSHSSSDPDLENFGSSTESVPEIKVPSSVRKDNSVSAPKPAPVDVSELKMRLERIKKMATS